MRRIDQERGLSASEETVYLHVELGLLTRGR